MKSLSIKNLFGKYLIVDGSWCPPCQEFRILLTGLYSKLNELKNVFDVVYVPSERNVSEYNQVIRHQIGWKYIPLENKKEIKKLRKLYGVQDIPTLVVIESESLQVVALDGRLKLLDDPMGFYFPWNEKHNVAELDFFILKNGMKSFIKISELETKVRYFLYYFSSLDAQNCNKIKRDLIEFYIKRKKKSDDIEMIFCSLNSEEQDFETEIQGHPWLIIPYKNPYISQLKLKFQIKKVPEIVITDASGNVVNPSAIDKIVNDLDAIGFPYNTNLFLDLVNLNKNDFEQMALAKPICFILMENLKSICFNTTKSLFKKYFQKYSNEIVFLISSSPNIVGEELRKLIGCPSSLNINYENSTNIRPTDIYEFEIYDPQSLNQFGLETKDIAIFKEDLKECFPLLYLLFKKREDVELQRIQKNVKEIEPDIIFKEPIVFILDVELRKFFLYYSEIFTDRLVDHFFNRFFSQKRSELNDEKVNYVQK